MSYDKLFRSLVLPKATYIFTDLDRLNPWQQQVAAERFRTLSNKGMNCLNDPSHVSARFELLNQLHGNGFNPQAVYRADGLPKPKAFPVFLRYDDHGTPISPLIHSQQELEEVLSDMRDTGLPLRGALVLEHCAEQYKPGLWCKWGAFKVGEQIFLDHIAVDNNWLVKYGSWNLLCEETVKDENSAVLENRYADQLLPAFKTANIDYGRADFSIVDGNIVIYEINTNPFVGQFVPDPIPLRLETQLQARRNLAEALSQITSTDRGWIGVKPCPLLKFRRGFKFGFLPYQQP